MLQKASPQNNWHYNASLKEFARSNRKNLTQSAIVMWQYILRSGQMHGYKFKRERPTLDYIPDFICLELMLIIEVDGITHGTKENTEKDRLRDRRLAEIGFRTLRFNALDVLNEVI